MIEKVHTHIIAELEQNTKTDTIFILASILLKMYRDQGVDGYYDPTLIKNYSTRYNLFMLVVLVTGIIAIVVPVVLIK